MQKALIDLIRRGGHRLLVCLTAGTCVFLVVVLAGCPATGDPSQDGNTNDNINDNGTGTGQLGGVIISFSTSFSLSELDPAASVLYEVTGGPDSISGFYVPVADANPAAGEVGDRVIVAPSLPATGPNTRFPFDPRVAGVGFFKVGVLLRRGDETAEALSVGVIQVEGPPDPRFIRPVEDPNEVLQGSQVPVAFDAGDPENDVQWRLFYLTESDARNNLPDELGTLLAAGRGNVGGATFNTAGLEGGDYQLGLSATDSGSSVAATVAAGNLERIITVLGPVVKVIAQADIEPPTFRFTAPGNTDVTLFRNEAFTIEFSTTINEPGASALIELFYDNDNRISNGFTNTVAQSLNESRTSFPLPTSSISEGTWFIGATIITVGGISAPVTLYANGTIEIVRNPTLTVVEPSSPLPVAPLTPVPISWTTNAPESAGTVSVVVRTLGTQETTTLLSAASISETSTVFVEETSGLYEVTVRLDFIDGDSLEERADALIRISSLPRILWLGSLADADPPFGGAIFGGVNFEDNAGAAFSRVNDIDADGLDDFLIVARYGGPFFEVTEGIGAGEAYLIFGRSGADRPSGEFNLNSVGTNVLPGVLFTGIRTPQDSDVTDGMGTASRLPDLDGDGRDELVFGFPNTKSRGHNVSPLQDGVIPPFALGTLEREDQFLRGGIVIVSSTNSALGSPDPGNAVINLDLVGQDFDVTCVEEDPDPPDDSGDFFVNIHSDVPDDPMDIGCLGTCTDPGSGGKPDATDFIDHGFVNTLARDYFSTYVYSFEFFSGTKRCNSPEEFVLHECLREVFPPVLHEYCAGFVASCEPFSPGLFTGGVAEHYLVPVVNQSVSFPIYSRHSGFYPERIEIAGETATNFAREPFGARIIGIGVGDKFGASLTMSGGSGTGPRDLIVSAPGRTARGILLGPGGGPEAGGEIDGLGTQINSNSGVAYLFPLPSLWTPSFGRIPPKPHQYVVGEASHCGGPDALIGNVSAIRIAGLPNDAIQNMIGIDDFNRDGRDDFAVGAPSADAGAGRVYISYRRDPGVEGDYVLERLALDQNDPQRLDGMLIVSNTSASLGASLATDMDFNGDGFDDLVIGAPDWSGGVGEVIVVFGNSGIMSPLNGISISALLAKRTADNRPVAARITGNARDATGRFGFNIANGGDLDGDGGDDLLIAAPGASPRFDPSPSDADDALTEPGLDLDFDGVQDDLVGIDDELPGAGIVYVLSSRNRLDQLRTCEDTGSACVADADCDDGDVCTSTAMTINIDQLGTSQLRGFMVVGRRPGDQIGGGDAGDPTAGGLEAKRNRGRSRGLAAAGDVDGDGRDDILIGSVVADPRIDPNSATGVQNGGEAYLIYGTAAP